MAGWPWLGHGLRSGGPDPDDKEDHAQADPSEPYVLVEGEGVHGRPDDDPEDSQDRDEDSHSHGVKEFDRLFIGVHASPFGVVSRSRLSGSCSGLGKDAELQQNRLDARVSSNWIVYWVEGDFTQPICSPGVLILYQPYRLVEFSKSDVGGDSK